MRPSPPGSAETAEQVRRLTRGALAQMRTLLLELRAQALEEVPIGELLRNVAEATEGRADIAVSVQRARRRAAAARAAHGASTA